MNREVLQCEDLYLQWGLNPVVEQRADDHYRVFVESPRAYVFTDVVRKLDGRWKVGEFGFYIDGELQPRSRFPEDYQVARAFRMANGISQGVVLDPLPPTVDVASLPPGVKSVYLPFAAKSPEMTIGFLGGRYFSGFDKDATQFRLDFRRRPNKAWQSRIRLVIGGNDYTRDVDDDHERAMTLMANPLMGGIDNLVTVGAPHGVLGVDSARQRKGTVMRN